MTVPRCFVTRNDDPSNPCAAVAPSATIIFGCTASISRCSHGLHAEISIWFGFSWMTAFSPRFPLEMLHHVRDVGLLAVNAGCSARHLSNNFPAGPTKGLPEISSWSPGCSPTKSIAAWTAPSPKTVCVARWNSGQPSQSLAAFRNVDRLWLSGINGSAENCL